MPDRYAIPGSEGEFEPGSNGKVLRNLLGITDPVEMDLAESRALIIATVRMMQADIEARTFTTADIRYLHRLWLGDIYPWAGAYRTVNVSKGGFPFARAAFVPSLMQELEDGLLADLTPCRSEALHEQARSVAMVHAELVLIHPFREGNGRVARMLSHAMASQCGISELDFNVFDVERDRYFQAIRLAQGRDYDAITALFEAAMRAPG